MGGGLLSAERKVRLVGGDEDVGVVVVCLGDSAAACTVDEDADVDAMVGYLYGIEIIYKMVFCR